MTLFDLIALSVILVSAGIGFVRGAVREVMTILAFVLAALIAAWTGVAIVHKADKKTDAAIEMLGKPAVTLVAIDKAQAGKN